MQNWARARAVVRAATRMRRLSMQGSQQFQLPAPVGDVEAGRGGTLQQVHAVPTEEDGEDRGHGFSRQGTITHLGFGSLSARRRRADTPRQQSIANGPGLDGVDAASVAASSHAPVSTPAAGLNRPGVFSPRSDVKAVWGLLKGSWLNLALLIIPFAWAADLAHWGAIPSFVLNFFALIPLALLLGNVTEDLALRFGETAGGLLNATFGNVTELILSITALVKGLYTVVAMSLIGSVLSNLLLVLGCCFLFGGSRYKEQSFNILVNKACCSLLLMASIAINIPTAAHFVFTDPATKLSQDTLQNISHATAILLAIIYLCYLLFQLKTHNTNTEDENEDGDEVQLSLVAGLAMLAAITVCVAVCSEFLTGSINEVSELSGGKLGQAFLGLIILPIAGNAAEHITAVVVATKNKMDLAIGVALGSSVQIAVFVLPVVVLVGWAIGKPLTLAFDPISALLLTLSIIHAFFVSIDGASNWLMGVELIATYVLIALLYGLVPNIQAGTDVHS